MGARPCAYLVAGKVIALGVKIRQGRHILRMFFYINLFAVLCAYSYLCSFHCLYLNGKTLQSLCLFNMCNTTLFSHKRGEKNQTVYCLGKIQLIRKYESSLTSGSYIYLHAKIAIYFVATAFINYT